MIKNEYSEKKFTINISEDTIIFSGKLELSDYTELTDFLEQGERSLNAETIKIDIRELVFLNSSGLRMLASFLTGSPNKLEIYINTSVKWQDISVKTLSYLRPGEIRIILEP